MPVQSIRPPLCRVAMIVAPSDTPGGDGGLVLHEDGLAGQDRVRPNLRLGIGRVAHLILGYLGVLLVARLVDQQVPAECQGDEARAGVDNGGAAAAGDGVRPEERAVFVLRQESFEAV